MPGRYDVSYDLDFKRAAREPSMPAKPPKRIKEPWEDLLGVVQTAAPGVGTAVGGIAGGLIGGLAGGGPLSVPGAIGGATAGGTIGGALGTAASGMAGSALDEQERKFEEGAMQDYQLAEMKRAAKDQEDQARAMLVAQMLGGL